MFFKLLSLCDGNPLTKGELCRALLSVILAWMNCWIDNWVASDLRHNDAHVTSLWCAELVYCRVQYLISCWSCTPGNLLEFDVHTRRLPDPDYQLSHTVNMLRPGQICQHFADDVFKFLFFCENCGILIQIILKFQSEKLTLARSPMRVHFELGEWKIGLVEWNLYTTCKGHLFLGEWSRNLVSYTEICSQDQINANPLVQIRDWCQAGPKPVPGPMIPWSTDAYMPHSMALTHLGRVTHIYVSKLTNIGSDNGLSPDRRQAIIWTNPGILLIGPLGTNVSEILIEIYAFSFKKMHLKMFSGKWLPFCLCLNVLAFSVS